MNKHISKAFGILFLFLELAIVPKAIDLMLNQHFSSLSTIRIVTLAMNFGSIALCILMSFSSMSDHESYPLHTFLFELMVFLCFLAPMTDLITRAIDSSGKAGMNMFVNTVFYMTGINIAYVIMQYEFLIIGADKKPSLKNIKKTASLLMILDNIATLFNIRFGYFFTITESGMYQSAPTFWMAYIVPLCIIAVTVITAAREMNAGRQRKAFLFFWIFAISSSVFQMWQKALTVQYTGYTLSLIVIYMNIQSELDISGLASSNREDY